jgi:hypothetical protein
MRAMPELASNRTPLPVFWGIEDSGLKVPAMASTPRRLRQTFQILRTDLDEAMPCSIDVGDQNEGRRDDK